MRFGHLCIFFETIFSSFVHFHIGLSLYNCVGLSVCAGHKPLLRCLPREPPSCVVSLNVGSASVVMGTKSRGASGERREGEDFS